MTILAFGKSIGCHWGPKPAWSIEEGNHNQLMDLHGRYYEFFMSSELIDTEKLDNENKFISLKMRTEP